MREDGKLDYIELPDRDLPATKVFYATTFGWSFQDYGPTYAAFSEGWDGGFDGEAEISRPLPVLFATNLEAMQDRVEAAGGRVTWAIFSSRRQTLPFPRSGRQ